MDGRVGFNLGHDNDFPVCVFKVSLAVETEARGACAAGYAADTIRRVFAGFYGHLRFFAGVDVGNEYAENAGIQHPLDHNEVVPGGARHRADAVVCDSLTLAYENLKVSGAVLHVDHDKIRTRFGDDLGRYGAHHLEPRANGLFAVLQHPFEVVMQNFALL
ncbi:hypothetical protein SDC9_198666 [bioreactor metagenome]|uniref:Uncharacterized protein n=1 Tax=bioreactor metagenome TaxID=1076179 RepID=A0A645IIB4_9ZZZZ